MTSKTKAYNTYLAPQAAYRSCSGAVVSQTANRSRFRPARTDFGWQPNSHTQP